MRNIYILFLSTLLCINTVNASTSRSQTLNKRNESNIVTRNASTTTIATRKTANKSVARGTKNIITNRTQSTQDKKIITRTAQNNKLSARNSVNSNILKQNDTNYEECKNAYFTCMDQFCATQNDTYRRCVCSSRLTTIQDKEKKLSQTLNNLQSFQDTNIDSITKTSEEIQAMLSASSGEQQITDDNSDATTTLNTISDILNNTKKKSALQNQASIDVTDNIQNIWSTTNFIGGKDISNLSGESLYNAVHTQCTEIVSNQCTSNNLIMASSAYGIYIDNDCSIVEDNITKQINSANIAILNTRQTMQSTRLDNYNTHNSLSLTDCLTKVKSSITADTACGQNYIHCLDTTGIYINITTGEPIYSSDFYKLENMLSMNGDILNNATNQDFVNMLQNKRSFAESSLNSCKDSSENVWNSFLRQAITEIYQQQQKIVQNVKTECLQTVNECYTDKTQSLTMLSDNTSDNTLTGQTIELAEDLCQQKLTTCSNLYGGGTNGLDLLITTMQNINTETITQNCPELLTSYVQSLCSVGIDYSHVYPYGCRTYSKGDIIYANTAICNSTMVNPFDFDNVLITNTDTSINKNYICDSNLKKYYTKCNINYYLTDYNECASCPSESLCLGGTTKPISDKSDIYNKCGVSYIGSLTHQLVRYALNNCTRPSDDTNLLSETILADIEQVITEVTTKLTYILADECEQLGGIWVNTQWTDFDNDGLHDVNSDQLLIKFYNTTNANKTWGYCKQ